MPVEDFFNRYSMKGYKFSDEVLTRYVLSLNTKPFVILSGISGTGKTKIAQLFDVEIPDVATAGVTSTHHGSGDIILRISGGMRNGDRGNLQVGDIGAIFEPSEITTIDAKIKEILKERPKSTENITDPITMTIVKDDGKEAQVGVYLQRAQSPLLRVRVQSKRGAAESYNSTDFFSKNYSEGDVLKLRKVGVHRFEIDSVNNKMCVYRSLQSEKKRLSLIDNKCFISVKSNWTDSSEMFGFYNPLTEKYTVTKLLKFLILANENPEIPFFLILDEMNLSKVEHYFSDFLSCLESRYTDQHGNLKQEEINLHSGSSYVATDDDEYDEIKSSISIPCNFYVTGTVNIDDTTYMFSPKVLDRANVIEFNEVYLDSCPSKSDFKLRKFPDFCEFKKSELAMYEALSVDVKERLKRILAILQKYNLHFGYRTISEVSHFILNAKTYIEDSEDVENTALDIQLLQKVLPKLYGNYSKLHDPMKELIYELSDSSGGVDNFTISEIQALDLEKTSFERSLGKLCKMYGTIATQGFVSFIE